MATITTPPQSAALHADAHRHSTDAGPAAVEVDVASNTTSSANSASSTASASNSSTGRSSR